MRGSFATAERWNRYYAEQAAMYAGMARRIIDKEHESIAAAPDSKWSTFWDWTRAEGKRASVFRAILDYNGLSHLDELYHHWADAREALLAKKGSK